MTLHLGNDRHKTVIKQCSFMCDKVKERESLSRCRLEKLHSKKN